MLKTLVLILLAVSFSVEAAAPAPVVAKKFMVVSAHRAATEVGYEILKQGGNAVDAAVAIGYALSVVYPCCGNLGGGGFMLIRFPDGRVTSLNFREIAPSKSNPSLFINAKGEVIFENLSTDHLSGGLAKPYLAVAIPGTVMGLNTALQKYGTLPLKKIITPAIKLAEQGFVLSGADEAIFKRVESVFRKQPNVSAIYLKNGQSYGAGERLIQKQLATTLKIIAKEGTRGFYHGKIADEIVKASTEQGGLITKTDLEKYTVEERQPIICSYRGYGVVTTPPPGSGITVCEILKILEPYPLQAYGYHAAFGTHFIVEAMRFAYADRNLYLGDPNFVNNPIEFLLSTAHIRHLRSKIKLNRASTSGKPAITAPEGNNTTSFVVVDGSGMAVSVTYTLNDYFGAKVIPGTTGFFLNNQMADFTIKPSVANSYGLYQGLQNLLAPGKRPLSSMSPTLLTFHDQLYLVVGTPGGSTIPSQLVNVILNIIDYGMNIQEAENAPRFHMQWLPNLIYVEPFTFSLDTQRILEKMGYYFHLGSPYGTKLWGSVSGIISDHATKKLYGAIDSRSQNGSAMGE